MAIMSNSRLRQTTFCALTLITFVFTAACSDDSSSSSNSLGAGDASVESTAGDDGGTGITGKKPADTDPTDGDRDAGSDDKPSGGDTDASADPGDADAGTDADGGVFVGECEGEEDETSCGEGGFCFDERCAPSRCGDGVVDDALGEQCEDGNDEGGDGCTLCRFDCAEDIDCDDGNSCNGAESCDVASHICRPGTELAEETACKDAEDGEGVCRNLVCVPEAFGNGIKDDGEECDTGRDNGTLGCTTTCQYTCKSNADCDNGNACDGEETCNVATHICSEGEPIVCEAVRRTCLGVCQPDTGACEYPDLDQDGSSCDLDCSDADPAVFPGGFECKDGKDNDCDDATPDSTSPGCECYVDRDKDGYAANTTGAIAAAGACPEGYTRTKPIDSSTQDCGPRVAAAYPGQPEYFPTPYCPADGLVLCLKGSGSFDYDCNGDKGSSSAADSKTAALSCAIAGDIKTCVNSSGWVGRAIPACGASGTYRSCSWTRAGTCSGTDTANRVRPCH